MPAIRQKLTAAAVSAAMAAAMCSALPMGAFALRSAPVVSMELLAGGSALGMEVYFTLPGNDTLDDWTVTLDGSMPTIKTGDGEWSFSVEEYAMDMTKVHTLTLTPNDGDPVTKTFSVKSYLEGFVNDTDYGDLAKAILMYGGAAQTYFDIDTDTLASDDVDGTLPDTIAAEKFDKTDLNAALEVDDAPVSYYGMNLSLKSETVFTLYFQTAEGSTQDEALDYLSGATLGGAAVSPKANGTDFVEMSVTVPAKSLCDDYLFELGDVTAAFSPAQYLAAAQDSGDEKLANVCKALYGYATVAKTFTAPAHTPPSTTLQSDAFVTRKGRATTYNYQVGHAHLDDYVKENGAYMAALTDDDYAAYAGGMIEITYGKKTITAIVGDSMMLANNSGRKPGDVDLDPNAFKELTGETTGDFDITWRIVPNSYAEDETVQYHFEHGSNPYYFKVEPINTTYPVKTFEYKVGSGDYISLQKTDDNCYEIKSTSSMSVVSFRMTDIFDQTIEEVGFDTGITSEISTNKDVPGNVQFPR